jgi:hypothetical protein
LPGTFGASFAHFADVENDRGLMCGENEKAHSIRGKARISNIVRKNELLQFRSAVRIVNAQAA